MSEAYQLTSRRRLLSCLLGNVHGVESSRFSPNFAIWPTAYHVRLPELAVGRVPRTRCGRSPLCGATDRRLVTVEKWPAAANQCSVIGAGVIADADMESRPAPRHLLLFISGSEYSVHNRPHTRQHLHFYLLTLKMT